MQGQSSPGPASSRARKVLYAVLAVDAGRVPARLILLFVFMIASLAGCGGMAPAAATPTRVSMLPASPTQAAVTGFTPMAPPASLIPTLPEPQTPTAAAPSEPAGTITSTPTRPALQTPTAAPSTPPPPALASPTAAPTTAPLAPLRVALAYEYPQALVVDRVDSVRVTVLSYRQQAALVPLGAEPQPAVLELTTYPDRGSRKRDAYQVTLYPVMCAVLGPSHIPDVISIQETGHPDDYFIRDTRLGPVTWVWDVIGRIPGEQKLTLSVYGAYQADCSDRMLVLNVQTDPIRVETQGFLAGLREMDAADLLSADGILGAVLVAALVALLGFAGKQAWGLLRRRKPR